MTPQETGKWFEKKVIALLNKMMEHHSVYYHRLVDSHGAGRFVQPQPSDLLFCSPRMGTIFLELKSSQEDHTAAIKGAKILRPTQYGKAKLLIRAGQVPMVLFYDYHNDEIELWLTETLISNNAMREKKPVVRAGFDQMEEVFLNNLI